LRLLRLLRILKLLRVFPSLRSMVGSIFSTFKPIVTLLVFMGIVVYVFAIPCVVIVGNREAGYPGFNDNVASLEKRELAQFNNYRFFGTVWRSMLTLFNMSMQSDELVEVLRATSEVQRWPPLFFIFFVLLMTLCLFNTIVGVVVDHTVTSILSDDEQRCTRVHQQVEAIEGLASLMFEVDSNHDDSITVEELQKAASDPRLVELLTKIKLPFGFTVEELFATLDQRNNGQISRNEFIGGLFRIVYSNDFQRQCLLRLGQTRVLQSMAKMKEEIIIEMKAEQQHMMSQIQACFAFVASSETGHQSMSGLRVHNTSNKLPTPFDFCKVGIPKAMAEEDLSCDMKMEDFHHLSNTFSGEGVKYDSCDGGDQGDQGDHSDHADQSDQAGQGDQRDRGDKTLERVCLSEADSSANRVPPSSDESRHLSLSDLWRQGNVGQENICSEVKLVQLMEKQDLHIRPTRILTASI